LPARRVAAVGEQIMSAIRQRDRPVEHVRTLHVSIAGGGYDPKSHHLCPQREQLTPRLLPAGSHDSQFHRPQSHPSSLL